jgi:hypothetical protein
MMPQNRPHVGTESTARWDRIDRTLGQNRPHDEAASSGRLGFIDCTLKPHRADNEIALIRVNLFSLLFEKTPYFFSFS